MLGLLLALLAFTALSVTGSAIPPSAITSLNPRDSTDTSNGTVPHSILAAPAPVPCDLQGNEQNNPYNCWCFPDGDVRNTVDRGWLLSSVNDACKETFTGKIGEPVVMYGSDLDKGYMQSGWHTWPYCDTAEFPGWSCRINIQVHIDMEDPACVGPIPLGYDECIQNLNDRFDTCDMQRENMKNGGFSKSHCFWWLVDSAPAFRQPYPPETPFFNGVDHKEERESVDTSVAAAIPTGLIESGVAATGTMAPVNPTNASTWTSASSASSADATSLVSRDSNITSNATIPVFNKAGGEMLPCMYEGNEDGLDNCWCFPDEDPLYSVDRHWMGDASIQACREFFTGKIGEPMMIYGADAGFQHYKAYVFDYEDKFVQFPNDEGHIKMQMIVDHDDPHCGGPIPIGYDWCVERFKRVYDSCDMQRENGKNGGLYLANCIWWVIDPAPAYREPVPHIPELPPIPNRIVVDSGAGASAASAASTAYTTTVSAPTGTLSPASHHAANKIVDSAETTSNSTLAKRVPPSAGSCDYEGSDGPDGCLCFVQGPGAENDNMIDAISRACDAMTGGIGEPASFYSSTRNGGEDHYHFTYTYTPAYEGEEGKILAYLTVNKEDPACEQAFWIGWQACWDGFMHPTGGCDTGGTGHKHGGFNLDNCVWWSIDPAPSLNQPYPFE